MLKKLLFMGCLLGILTSLNAQTTETFESATVNSSSFTSATKTFNLNSSYLSFLVASIPGVGYNSSNRYIQVADSAGPEGLGQTGTLTAVAGSFKVSSLWIYLTGNSSQDASVTSNGAAGSVTFRGKLAGVTQFTVVKTTTGANTGYASPGNGFVLIDFTTAGGSNNTNFSIDQLEVQLSNNYDYFAIDNFTFTPVVAPTITTTGTTTAFSSCAGTASSSQNFTVGGTNLTANITVTAPTGFEVSTTSGSGYANSITLTQSSGTVPSTAIYTRLATTATGLPSGNIACASTGATTKNIVVSGTVSTIVVTPTSQTNIACNGGATGAASVTVSGGTPTYSYSWSPSGGTGATATGLFAGTYVCTVTDANGCTKTKSFTITQPAAITATTSQTNIACNGGATGVASVTVSGGTPTYSYSWAPSGGTAATATGLSAGTYICTITDANGCQITKSFTITQPAAINTTVTLSSGVLTASQTGATYQWYNCSNNSPVGTNNNTFTPTQSGNYKVDITVGSCTVTSTCVTVTTLGINDFEKNTKFVIYPNPTSNIVHINSEIDGNIQIVNQLGQTVKTSKVKANEINTLNIENLTDGVYFVKVSNQAKSYKLIIKK